MTTTQEKPELKLTERPKDLGYASPLTDGKSIMDIIKASESLDGVIDAKDFTATALAVDASYAFPLDKLEAIQMYMDGKIEAVHILSNHEAIYQLQAKLVYLSFEDTEAGKSNYSFEAGDQLIQAITFYADKNENQFYVVI